jgi:ATP-dependent Clp protease ATP-binding subunit ClpX
MKQEQFDFEYTRPGPGKETGPAGGYPDDMAMLRDYFQMFDAKRPLVRKAQGNVRNRAEWEMVYVQARRIDERLVRSKPQGRSGYLIRQFKSLGLDPLLRQTVAFLCYCEARGQTRIDLGEVMDFVCEADRIKMIPFRQCLFSDHQVYKAGLLVKDLSENMFRPGPALRLGSKVRAGVFGIYEDEAEASRPEPGNKTPAVEKLASPKSPRQIYQELSKHILGQERACRAMSVALYNHLQRAEGRPGTPRSNVFMVGPTGCGKTYLMETASRLLDIPIAMVDATLYTETGYMGRSINGIFNSLHKAAGGDAKKAARGVIFIDEIDKIATVGGTGSGSVNRDISGEGVQQDLLKILEGSVQDETTFPVDKVMFVAGGAFSKIGQWKAMASEKRIGFVCGTRGAAGAKTTGPKLEDLISYGMLPELLGRFQTLVAIEPLSRDCLKRILTEPQNSLVSQYREMFQGHGIELVLTEETLALAAERAAAMGTGARALKSVLDEILQPLVFENIGSGGEAKELVVTPEMAEHYMALT